MKSEGKSADSDTSEALKVLRDPPTIDGAYTVPPIGPPYKRVWQLADELAQVL